MFTCRGQLAWPPPRLAASPPCVGHRPPSLRAGPGASTLCAPAPLSLRLTMTPRAVSELPKRFLGGGRTTRLGFWAILGPQRVAHLLLHSLLSPASGGTALEKRVEKRGPPGCAAVCWCVRERHTLTYSRTWLGLVQYPITHGTTHISRIPQPPHPPSEQVWGSSRTVGGQQKPGLGQMGTSSASTPLPCSCRPQPSEP